MKKLVGLFLAVMAVSVSANDSPKGHFYVGGGVSNTLNDWDGTHWSPVEVFGGYQLNPYLGGELRLGASSGATKISDYESIYYRAESTSAAAKTYLLLGYTRFALAYSGGSYNFSGVSYGAGLGFAINKHYNFNLEYKILAKGSGSQTSNTYGTQGGLNMRLSSLSATVDYHF